MQGSRRRAMRLLLAAFVGLCAGQRAGAAPPEEEGRGEQIAREADRRQRGFGDVRSRMEMVLRDRRGQTTRRLLDSMTLEISESEQKSLVYFESPRDIRGTALLTHSRSGAEDEQWLYLPALKRTKRISVKGRSAPFMGSEFSYEDLATTNVDRYEYAFVEATQLRGVDVFVVDRRPKYAGTGYSKQRVWYDQKEYRVLQIEYWDAKDRRLKTLALGGYRKYLDAFWEPAEARMENHQTGESTVLHFRDYRHRTGLDASDFTRQALGRAR